MKKDEWKLIGDYSVADYRCGLRAGQTIALKRDLIMTNSDGPTGEIQNKGKKYIVLHGSKKDPGVVWLRKDDGHRCTWDDEPEIFDWFDVVDGLEETSSS